GIHHLGVVTVQYVGALSRATRNQVCLDVLLGMHYGWSQQKQKWKCGQQPTCSLCSVHSILSNFGFCRNKSITFPANPLPPHENAKNCQQPPCYNCPISLRPGSLERFGRLSSPEISFRLFLPHFGFQAGSPGE